MKLATDCRGREFAISFQLRCYVVSQVATDVVSRRVAEFFLLHEFHWRKAFKEFATFQLRTGLRFKPRCRSTRHVAENKIALKLWQLL